MAALPCAASRMRTLRTRVWRARPWEERPSLGHTGTRPVGRPFLLVVVLAVAIAVHGFQRASSRAPVAVHGDIAGKAWVIDGDTIDMAGFRIRLQGIDAPESNQTCTDAGNRTWPCGRAATRELVDHVAGRQLKCESSGLDRYRRVLAVCALPDGSDVNAWLVREGWALAYGYDSPYQPVEAQAQAARRGIWAGSFMPPWEWRHRHVN
jgi:endonuclease YncB( thermonuclease family)